MNCAAMRLGRRVRRREYAAVGGHVLDQELHLVREDLAVGQYQVLGLVRHVRGIDELQPGLLRQAVALDAVARAAGGYHVHPGVGAAARHRPDVIARQSQVAESACAIGADVAVAAEQLAIVERRNLIESAHRHRLALDRDDRAGGDAGASSGLLGNPPVENELALAERPGDQVLGVVEARLLPGNPAVRYAVIIECQNQRNFTRHFSKLLPKQSSAGIVPQNPSLRHPSAVTPPLAAAARPARRYKPRPSSASSRAWRALR